jgi:hypothetical protein
VNDTDLMFAVTLRSGHPDQGLTIANADNNYIGFFVQDDWHVHPQFTVNLGLRYELDTNVKNLNGVDDLNPLILPFLEGTRGKDTNNWGPRIGMNWATKSGRFSVHAGYGIYYDRITLEIASLERGLDGRALPIEVRAGNVFFIEGPPPFTFGPGAPTLEDPFTGFILPGEGAGGINIIDNDMQNPSVQQFNFGLQQQIGKSIVLRAEGIHNLGTHFIIGRPIGEVFNPVVGGPDVVSTISTLGLDATDLGNLSYGSGFLTIGSTAAGDMSVTFPGTIPGTVSLVTGGAVNVTSNFAAGSTCSNTRRSSPSWASSPAR